jgi:polysaccharide biosynthesis/export protein
MRRRLVVAALVALGLLPLCSESQQTKPKPRQPSQDAPSAQTGGAPAPNAASQGATSQRSPVQPSQPPVPAPVSFEPATAQELALGYPLGIGDVVRVVVFQQPDMTAETRVSEAGTITIPLLGPVPVGGVTAKRAEDRIATLLKNRGYVRDPQVVVTVIQFKSRQVSVLGLVSRPGRYALEEGIYRLSDVLALAGGVLPDGADIVTLVRAVDGKSQRVEVDLPSLFRSGDFSKNPEMMAGDSIYVARAPVVYIYGEVNRPGAFRLDKDMTVMQALSLAGGLTARGTEKNLQIRRRDAGGHYVTTKGSLTDSLRGDDVIFIRESLF